MISFGTLIGGFVQATELYDETEVFDSGLFVISIGFAIIGFFCIALGYISDIREKICPDINNKKPENAGTHSDNMPWTCKQCGSVNAPQVVICRCGMSKYMN